MTTDLILCGNFLDLRIVRASHRAKIADGDHLSRARFSFLFFF
jgi:hypothetical protein